MTENQIHTEVATQQIYDYAADLLFNQDYEPTSVKQELINKGLDASSADLIICQLQESYSEAKHQQGRQDMLWGAVWCIGGIVATAANIGFIFYGAIFFGAIQFFSGVIKVSS